MNARSGYTWGPALLAAGALVAGCGGAADSRQPAGADDAPVRVVNVEVLQVAAEPFAEFINVTGEVRADRDVIISSEESGVVREILVDRGRPVQEGQPIARLDDRLLRAQFDQARSEAALARETWERQRRLWEEDGIGSELGYLRARHGAETAAAQERVLATRLERTTVRAPIAGVLDERFIEVGASLAPGTPVARIMDTRTIKVTAGVPERYAADIRQGSEVLVTFEHLPGQEYRARTRYVGTALNEQNRTFPVEVEVANGGGVLKPGMVARVQVGRRTVERALLIPREAVVRGENGFLVYVARTVGDETVAEARDVQLGATAAGRVVVAAGLDEGDRVVVVGQQQVAAGDVLRVVAERGASR